MSPDRVVVGVESEQAREMMESPVPPVPAEQFQGYFYRYTIGRNDKVCCQFDVGHPHLVYERYRQSLRIGGADVNMVRKGIGSDSRIGSKFLYPGCGYGGSCFPKDVKALIKTAEKAGYPMRVLQAVEEVNEAQKAILYKKLSAYYDGAMQGKKIALWGLSVQARDR